LLSPSKAERDAMDQAVLQNVLPATVGNLIDATAQWRKDASSNADSMTWFYFSGHGLMRSNQDGLLLMQDFTVTADRIRRAAELQNIYHGMKPGKTDYLQIARRQLYFIDSCRSLHEDFKKLEEQRGEDVFGVYLGGEDNRSAPILFATVP